MSTHFNDYRGKSIWSVFSREIRLGMMVLFSLVLGFVSATDAQDAQPTTEKEIDFNRDIRPILSDRCYKCHGPDENTRDSDLRLDKRDEAADYLEGDTLADISLWQRVSSLDPDEQMPPPESKLKLTASEKETLRKWLQQGAPYATHWSFVTPQKAELPKVTDSKWPRNEIDYFVKHRLEAEGIQPNARASKERLIRRVTFDLIGLPPTLKEIDAFLGDQSPDAFEKVVDGLLKREEFGERLTAEWLDVARYSDSFGYQVDRGRHIWPYRDWVLNAFNSNLPYDQFIIQQLAGDLLPNATQDQILATAFNRLHGQKVEGGSVPEEFRVEYVADRSHTYATAFLGLTMECARCHDHKYDPLSQNEYYQLFAYFNNIDEAGLYSYFTSSTPTPTLLMTNPQQRDEISKNEKSIREKELALAELEVTDEDVAKWLKEQEEIQFAAPIEHLDFDDFKSGRNLAVEGKFGKAVKLTGDDAVDLKSGDFKRFQPFAISLWINTPDKKERAVVFHRSRAWTDAASRGYQLLIENGRLSASLIHFWPGNAIRVITKDEIKINQWTHVTFSYDGSSRASGLKIYVDGSLAETTVVQDQLYKNITGGGGNNIRIGERFRDLGFKNGLVDDMKVFDRQLSDLEIAGLPQQISKRQAPAWDSLSKAEKDLWRQHYLTVVDDKRKKAFDELTQLRTRRSQLIDGITEVMVMNERTNRRKTYRLNRGAYDQPDNEVQPGVPAELGIPVAGKTRLDLARWTTDPRHPLTARVAVNRYWQLIFGDGLVRTPEDFGSQGSLPTHPKLLDWLAVDFIENGWDLKRLLKQMVMSSTYQQDSTLTKSSYQRDPGNRLLARTSSYRLPAEMLRDNALAVSGLLTRQIGGNASKPYDLALSFKPLSPDKGNGVYRRSVYTYWKRTGPSPVMMTLDAAKRDVCTVKRERTATPLQAFVLLNDPQFVEAARGVAENLIREIQQKSDDKATAIDQVAPMIEKGFRKLTGRKPNDTEKEILKEEFEFQLDYFKKSKPATDQFLAIGQKAADPKLDRVTLSALTVVMQAIMNFDECLIKR